MTGSPIQPLRQALCRSGVLFVLVWLPYAYMVGRFWFVTDDAYISFRYAQNLALGHGLRYNLGPEPPVEGYSNFLWVVIASIFESLGLDVAVWMPLLSAFCGSALLFLVLDRLHRRLGLSPAVAAAAVLTLGFYPPFAAWSTSGLETMPFTLLLFLVFDRLVLAGGDWVPAAVFGLLLALVRIDGIAWAAGVAAVALLGTGGERGNLRAVLRFAALVGGGFALYFAWRWWYHGAPLPNTVYVKAGLPPGHVLRGLDYVAVQFLTFLAPFATVATSFLALRQRFAAALPVVVLAWASAAYAVLTTGDFMAMGRFLVPSLPFAAILLAWALSDLAARGPLHRLGAAAAVLTLLGLGALPGWDLHLVPESVRARFHFRHNTPVFRSEYAQWRFSRGNPWVAGGKALRSYARERLEKDASLVTAAAGAAGYYSGLRVYDLHGLVTPEVAHRTPSRKQARRSPGHDRAVPATFFLDRRPTLLLAGVVVARDAREAQAQIGGWTERLRTGWPRLELEKRYVPDFAPMPPDEDGLRRYLVVWRRLDGEDWRTAWSELIERLRKLS